VAKLSEHLKIVTSAGTRFVFRWETLSLSKLNAAYIKYIPSLVIYQIILLSALQLPLNCGDIFVELDMKIFRQLIARHIYNVAAYPIAIECRVQCAFFLLCWTIILEHCLLVSSHAFSHSNQRTHSTCTVHVYRLLIQPDTF